MTNNLVNANLPEGHLDKEFVCNNANKELTGATCGTKVCLSKCPLSPSQVRELQARRDKRIESKLAKERVQALMMPVSKYPNILDHFVEIKEKNKLMEKHGISKRNAPGMHIAVGLNKPLNVYLKYLQVRLNHLVNTDRTTEYWAYCDLLLKKSSVFKAMMLHEVYPKWSTEWNYKQLYIIIDKFIRFSHELPVDMKYRRIYIPKKTDSETGEVLKWRPLGVPTSI